MSPDGRGEGGNPASPGRPDGVLLDRLRAVALFVVFAGAASSLGLMLRAGRRTPRFLLVLFVIWVLAPFAALARANMVSTRWSAITRTTLYWATLVVTLVSVAIYGGIIKPPAGSPGAFVFVAVPPASSLTMMIVVSMAALISQRVSRRGAGA